MLPTDWLKIKVQYSAPMSQLHYMISPKVHFVETSIPSDHHLWLCVMKRDRLWLQTGLLFGLWGLVSFWDCAHASFPPFLISSSGVCDTLGGERRLLQPRFVVSTLTPPLPHSVFTCMIRRPSQRPLEDSMGLLAMLCINVPLCDLFL